MVLWILVVAANVHFGTSVVRVVDVKHEVTALKEARKLGIPTVGLIDTDGDPDMVDIPIPGNDDSMRSIDVVIRELCLAIVEGRDQRSAVEPVAPGGGGGGGGDADNQPRRSRRAQFRADDANSDAPRGETAAPTQPAVST